MEWRRSWIAVLGALAAACANGGEYDGAAASGDRFAKARATDVPKIAEGWSAPVRLDVSGDYWGDSLWVTPDGSAIYFMYYPGDAMTDVVVRGEPKHDPDVYVSEAPFRSMRPVDRFQLDHPVWGCAGPMIDDSGDFWFMSNRQWEEDRSLDTDIYRNGEFLAFNTDDSYTNPHSCVATDELWFDLHDERIMVLRDAAENGFAGEAELAPEPPNSPKKGRRTAPVAEPDGRTMYFRRPATGSATVWSIFTCRRRRRRVERADPGSSGVRSTVSVSRA
ncbi:MAG: hypothetical protein R3F34_04410 [Planctomycetota bacterium]